jgi:hypothetical protein
MTAGKDRHLPHSTPPRYIRSMSKPMTTYVVDAYDSKEKVWKTVLSTKDRAEAEAMKEAMEQDGVRARLSEFRAKKR